MLALTCFRVARLTPMIPLLPHTGKYKEVDLTGTVNLIEGAKKAGMKKFVLLTSLLTNAKAIGQENNPNYKFLNAFGGGQPRVTFCE